MAANKRPKGITDQQWLEMNLDKSGRCWIWTGGCQDGGESYGLFWRNGHWEKAHRVAYEITNGVTIPPATPDGCALEVQHTCNNPRCCNPDHLVLGRRLANRWYRQLCTILHGGQYTPIRRTGHQPRLWQESP